MERENLKIFTKISYFTAMAAIIIIPIYIFISSITSGKGTEPILRVFTFLGSLFASPLSIVSMFSKENLVKRIFTLIMNLLPISIIIYGLILEFIDEFLRTAP